MRFDEGLDEGLRWRGRVSDGEDSDDDAFGFHAEGTTNAYLDLTHGHDDYDDGDGDENDDGDDDPLGGLVTIGDLGEGDGGAGDDAGEDESTATRSSDDFLKQLEELIERDMPKVKITDEYQKVLDAVDASDGGLLDHDENDDRKRKEAQSAIRDEDDVLLSAGGEDGADNTGTHERDDRLPDLGAVLGGERKDRDAEALEELIEGLVVDEDAEREKQRRAFLQLQSVCSTIMHVSRDDSTREQYLACVVGLRDVLERLDDEDVQTHRQYVLLPLCVILDAKVAVDRHDAALCGTLQCLRVLASKTRLDEHQGPPLMQRMMAMLGDVHASYSSEARRIMAEVLGAIFAGSYSWDDAQGSSRSYLARAQLRPLVGNALSVLLNHPYNDVTQPSNMLAANQVASLKALALLIVAAGREQMAFFVPGIATGLVKRLVMQLDSNLEGDVVTTKRASGGVVAALQGLEELFAVTLCARSDESDVFVDDPADYMAHLRQISSLQGQKDVETTSNKQADLDALEASIQTDKNTLRVEITPGWLRATAMRVSDLLKLCIPKLCFHHNPAVRLQVVHFASRVLSVCAVAFEGDEDVLVDSLLLLAQDDWPSVRSESCNFLLQGLGSKQRERLSELLLSGGVHRESNGRDADGDNGLAGMRSLLGLPHVLKGRPEVVSRREAARICSIIEWCQSSDMRSLVGFSGTDDDAVLSALVDCFEVEESSAATVASSPLIAAASAASDHGDAMAAVTALPTMPAALRYMTSKSTYDAFSRVPRLLAINALRHDVQGPYDTAFTGFVASCVRELHQLLRTRNAPPSGNGNASSSRLRCSAVMTVLSEVFAGAVELTEGLEDADTIGRASLICKTAALDVLYALQDGGVWLLPTNHCMSFDTSSRSRVEKGMNCINAILLHRCLVFVGVAARCLKATFVDDGSCAVTCILPVIERYSGDCQYVSAAAKDAVHSICRFCGYTQGMRDLITSNIDYIIDGMCIRLRQPSIYPDAPKLFAALLREEGVAVSLIPLLADPAQQMIRGVSIMQRREKPENVLAFVMCTTEIAKGLINVSMDGVCSLEALVLSHGPKEPSELEQADSTLQDIHVGMPDTEEDEAPAGIEEISKYFHDRRLGKTLDRDQNSAGGETIAVDPEVWESTLLTKSRLEAAAFLSQSIADSLGPLVVAKSLPVAVQSFSATTRALEGLHNAHQGLELFKNVIEERLVCQGQSTPPSGGKQAPPTFLPSVHLFWTPLMGSLKDWRVPVVEASIDALKSLLILAPDFLAKRFRNEAWPVLRGLLKEGTPIGVHDALSGMPGTLGGQDVRTGLKDGGASPALVSRIRRAVVGLFSELIGAMNISASRNLLQPIARPLLHDVLVHACESTDQGVIDAMRAGFECIASIHPDSAWATLYTYASSNHEGEVAMLTVGDDGVDPNAMAPYEDFRQYGDEWWWVTNQLQSLMI